MKIIAILVSILVLLVYAALMRVDPTWSLLYGCVRIFVCEAVWFERLFQRASVNRSS